mgnify:CR=1 FL=1
MSLCPSIVRAGAPWLVLAALLAPAAGHAGPVLETTAPGGIVYPDLPFRVVCEVSWDGPAAAYRVLPLAFEPQDWAEIRLVSSTSGVRDGRNVVVQEIEVTPTEPEGDYMLEGLAVPYVPAGEDPGETPPLTLRPEPIDVRVRPDRRLWYAAAAAVVAVALGILGALLVHRRQAQRAREAQVDPREAAQAALHEARRHRLDGDFYAFYLALVRAVEAVGGDPATVKRLQEQAQRVGYQGVRPADDELDEHWRDVEQQVTRNN